MTYFRFVLAMMTLAIIVLTVSAVSSEGINLLVPFFTPILELSWQGQFNVDFLCYLILSGIWMAWRSGFSGGGIALGIFAPSLGILFFAPYLLYLTVKCGGNVNTMLLGVYAEKRAD